MAGAITFAGAVLIVALVALEAVAAAVTCARTVLVRGADCVIARGALLGVCGASTITCF